MYGKYVKTPLCLCCFLKLNQILITLLGNNFYSEKKDYMRSFNDNNNALYPVAENTYQVFQFIKQNQSFLM